jgi:hypothetical protein
VRVSRKRREERGENRRVEETIRRGDKKQLYGVLWKNCITPLDMERSYRFLVISEVTVYLFF